MLRKQYDSVFSTPDEETTVSHPDEFFPLNDPVADLDNVPCNRTDKLTTSKLEQLQAQMVFLPYY